MVLSDLNIRIIFPIIQSLNSEIKSCFPLWPQAQALTNASWLNCLLTKSLRKKKTKHQIFVLLAQKRNGGRRKIAHWYYPQSLKAFCPSRFAFMQHEHLLWMYSFPGISCITNHLIEVVLLRGPWSVLPSWGHRIPRLHRQLLSPDPRVTL